MRLDAFINYVDASWNIRLNLMNSEPLSQAFLFLKYPQTQSRCHFHWTLDTTPWIEKMGNNFWGFFTSSSFFLFEFFIKAHDFRNKHWMMNWIENRIRGKSKNNKNNWRKVSKTFHENAKTNLFLVATT